MPAYDPSVIHDFAERMYRSAFNVLVFAVIAGVIGGFVGGYALGGGKAFWGVLGAILGCVVGYFVGLERGFWLKLEAQRALCLAEIEANTRRGRAH